ncbi:MAG: hypothetical protein CM15mP120_27910 [Pseudomonadota bacterium]|nr:MAG: hypothetical protein CM15mP120_27910 [Pseudomonadota bacterium]
MDCFKFSAIHPSSRPQPRGKSLYANRFPQSLDSYKLAPDRYRDPLQKKTLPRCLRVGNYSRSNVLQASPLPVQIDPHIQWWASPPLVPLPAPPYGVSFNQRADPITGLQTSFYMPPSGGIAWQCPLGSPPRPLGNLSQDGVRTHHSRSQIKCQKPFASASAINSGGSGMLR